MSAVGVRCLRFVVRRSLAVVCWFVVGWCAVCCYLMTFGVVCGFLCAVLCNVLVGGCCVFGFQAVFVVYFL